MPSPELRVEVVRAREVAQQLQSVPRELRPALRQQLRRVGQEELEAARARASWSTRIPRALTVTVRFGARRAGVRIEARRSIAPHARPYAGITGMTFRHPVFGDRERWVQQSARPFLPDSLRVAPSARRAADEAIAEAVRRAGIR